MKKNREFIKRLVSLFMALMMTFTCLPLEVFAEEIGEGESTVEVTEDTATNEETEMNSDEDPFVTGEAEEIFEDDIPMPDADLFVFAGQSNMMGAAVLEPQVNAFTDKAWEYKYMPKLRGAETGSFVPAQNPAGEWHYNDLNAAYGEYLNDLSYQSTLSNYSANTYFCPAMSNGIKGFSVQSEADMYASASLPPYFATEYASYGHSSIYAHMAKGSAKIVHYFTADMMNAYNALISEYNAESGKSYKLLTAADLTGAGDAFDAKYTAMLEDYATCTPDGSINNRSFVWLQGESDGSSYIEYKLKMQVLWEHLQTLGFTHFFVLRVGYWGNTSILDVIKAQEDFCAENDGCYIVTRAPSLIPHPSATTENWWISEPNEEYADCRDSYIVSGSGNHHFNEKAMQIFAERSAENIHRILYQGLDPILEEENIRGMLAEADKPEADQPEDTSLYTSYVGTEAFYKGLSVSSSSGKWMEKSSTTAASTDLIPVASCDSVWLQYVFYLSEAHAVGGFYDKEGNLVAPLYYRDFGFSLGGGGGTAAFLTPEATNRVLIADVESVTGKEIAFVRFTAWQASLGGHANTEARIYHTYTSTITAPTCTEQGFTTYTCECGDSFVDSYVEAVGHSYKNGECTICGISEPFKSLTLRYDDHYDVSGKTVEIVDAGGSVVTLEGKYIVATDVGDARVRIESELYHITVEKAKINIITIMGQSNAGNHFENATSDITCPLGTAYWWGNGRGVNAAEPIDYISPSMGFHAPLLAELYAQSVAAGDPVKNVMVWQEGITSKNGQSIVKWAASETNTSGTDATAQMIKNCVAYYEQHSDKFEIVSNGIYWLQGESDVAMDPEIYTKLFMAMWDDLKEAGAEYVAFFRVRKGTVDNDSEHNDLSYTGSLTAQLNMINCNSDMFLASTITENWVGNENVEHAIDISPYLTITEAYAYAGSHSDSYDNTAAYKDGILTTTMKSLYGSNNKCHYGKFGYGIIGADAALNMTKALNSNDVSFVVADTSGKPQNQRNFKVGETGKIDITEITENLVFRAACGSTAGTLDIKITSDGTNITEKVIAKGITTFGTVDTELLRDYDNVEIVITYNTTDGNTGKAKFEIVDNAPKTERTFIWDFNNDLNARDENGAILNGFNSSALIGEYKLEGGMLKATSLQLQLVDEIRLNERKNWSIAWKFGTVDENTKGFLFCNTEESKIGTKTIYISPDMKISISDYADSNSKKGYRNYYTDEATYASGDILRITNEYDAEKERGVLKLWKNGKLIVDDYQKSGNINKTSGSLSDMTSFPLSGEFILNYLGCKGIENFSVTGEIDYIRIWEGEHVHSHTSVVTAPTCIEQGFTTHACECGDSFVDSYVDATGKHSYENGFCSGCDARIPDPKWEIGTIASLTGKNNATNSRLRTVDYLNLTDFIGVGINEGYTMTNFVYDENYTYLGTSSWLGSGMPFETAELVEKYPTGVYFRVVFRTLDQKVLTEDAVSTSGVKFYLSGEEIPEPDLGFEYENVAQIGTWQEGAIWDGKLFVLNAAGSGAVFDVDTGTKLGNFTLDKKDVLKPHANSVCFGSTYYDDGDKYPLLYVNIYNNYANAEDRMEGTCCVYRLVEANGNFTTELVQVIRIGFTEDLSLWKSKENNGDVRPYGNFVVDTDNHQLYAFVMRDAVKSIRFFSFDIPNIAEGTYNETYGCNVVTLTTNDINDQFDTDHYNYLQGCCYSSGMILSVEDFGGDAPLRIIDLQNQRVSKTVYLGYAGLSSEPEVLSVDPDTGTLYYAAADGMLRIIKLDDVHFHVYTSTITAPTCTEQGFTTHACECGDSYVDSYVEAKGHSYKHGFCSGCGEKAPSLDGKTISILGASISTFAGTSNGIAADTTNSTIRNNAKYYPNSVVTDVELTDTWWMQVANDLGLRLLVNNSWSGSSLLHERNGTVGAYVDRCVQLHDDTGDNANEMPDIIGIQLGTNDFQYYKDTLGTANINYAALITENSDGSYTYATPVTSLEAAAIVLHKISVRYPNAEVYYLNISQRVDDTDELIQSFNGELKKVVEHFGAHIVDIYGSAITMADFDTYIGDGRVHPNKLGMDAYTEAFKKALVNNTAYAVDAHTVSLNLDGVTADYGDDKIVVDGSSYTVKLSVAEKMYLNVTVTMGDKDVTDAAYANGIVTLDSVTDDVTISAKVVYEPKEYSWTFNGTDLACVSGNNVLTKLSGSTTNGVFSKTSYALADEVVLLHDLPWVVEWKCEGTFLNTGGSSGARVFTSDNVNANYNARYIFKSNTNGLIAMGEKTTSGSHNYGIALADYAIDWTKLHTYRLENRIANDGSNMVWLSVDGKEVGALNNYYVGTTNKNTTSDWLSGKDFIFPYMGTDTHGFTNASIDHIAVWEGGHTHTYTSTTTAPTCTEQGFTTHACECGDSYVDSYVEARHSYKHGICTGCGGNYKDLTVDIESSFSHNIDAIDAFIKKYERKEVDDFNQLTVCMAGDSIFGRQDKGSSWKENAPEISYTPDVNDPSETKYGYQTGHFPPNMWIQSVPYKTLEKLQWDDADVKYFNHSAGEVVSEGSWVDAFPVPADNIRAKYTTTVGANMIFTFSGATHMKAIFPGYSVTSSRNAKIVVTFSTDNGATWKTPDELGLVASMVSEAEGSGHYTLPSEEYKWGNICFKGFDADTTYKVKITNNSAARLSIWGFETWSKPRINVVVVAEGGNTVSSQNKAPQRFYSEMYNPALVIYQLPYLNDLGQGPLARYIGRIDLSTAAPTSPTELDFYYCKETGVYTNFGGVSANAGDYIEFDGNTWKLGSTKLEAVLDSYKADNTAVFDRLAQQGIPVVAVITHAGTYDTERPFGPEVATPFLRDLLDDYDFAVLDINAYQKAAGYYTTTNKIIHADGTHLNDKGVQLYMDLISPLFPTVLSHAHKYEAFVTAPTCIERGYTTHTCTVCGDSYVDSYVNAKGHSYGNWTVTTAPTCTEKGAERRDCIRCDAYETREVAMAEHAYEAVVTPPTCTEQGYTTLICPACGDTKLETKTIDISDLFTWTNGKMIIATTGACTDYTIWQASGYVDISAFDSIVIKTANTISVNTTTGLAFYDANKNYISGVKHTDGVGKEYGTLMHTLEVPENAVYIRSTWYGAEHPNYEEAFGDFACVATGQYVPATGHSYKHVSTTPPTCTVQGTSVYTCSDCGDSYTEFASKTEHAYNDGVCIVCGHSILSNDWIVPNFAQGDYTMVVLPDTQNLVQYWPEIYYNQMQWITDNRDELNIQAVLHMGDMVNNNNDIQWTVCETGTDILESAGIPWMPMMGNHDNSTWFNKYYDYTTYGTNQSWFGGSYYADKLDHTYWYVTVGERAYMVLSLGWAPSWDVLDWAQGIVEENSDKSVILTCHAYMDKDGSLLSEGDAHCVSSYLPNYPNGDDVWAAFKEYENVALAMGGHIHNPDLVTRVDSNGAGQDVTSLLVDRQNDDINNRYAMVALLTFRADSDTVDVNWYSIRYDALYREKNQFSITVPHVCNHRWVSVETKATCTERGYTTHTCTVCGDSYVDSYVNAKGHSYGKWTVTTAPTCTEKGTERRDCVNCDHFETRAVAATGHTEVIDAAVVPTCTETGLTEGKHCSVCDTVLVKQEVVKAKDHSYKGIHCSACNAVHPNKESFEGKVISILSASTSTFAGYIPTADGFNLEHRARYPQNNLLTDVNETWWMQVINDLDAKLGINESWAGSQVLNTQDSNSGDLGPDAAMASVTRIKNLGANGTPDIIFFFGGGNDIGRGVTLGTFDAQTAPTQVDLTTKKWSTFADAYVAAIMRLQHFYPDAQIVVMTTYKMPSYATEAKLNKYAPVIQAICDHYGVEYVDLRNCGLTFDMLPDNIHPNAEGMDYITADVLDTLLNRVDLESSENVVYSVTHNLTNAGASLHYYKGVSQGTAFTETVSGEDVTVTVTMGGVDVTDHVYANGTISIPSVTGELIITAKGTFDADGHLQQLPNDVCAGINLWTALTPENIYYTATGWGNTSAGTTWSITFPVKAGDRIWATSLGAYPGNGSSANGVRVTWFDENGVLQTLSRDKVYAEFSKNGYITAPENAVALNLPMTGNQEHYAVYVLSTEHDYKDIVTLPTCTEQGYTTHTCSACGDSYVDEYVAERGHAYKGGACTICGVAQWDTDGDGALEILAIGNSFSVDALEYAYQIAQDLGIEEIVIGNLYIGGCTLATHATNAAGDLGKYTYYYNDNGTWTSTGSYKISTALESRSWDYVSMQQGSPVSGVESSYNEDLTNLIAYVKERSDAKLVWHMTWAYQQNSTHSAFPTYNKDQMTMYNAIVSAVQNKIVTNSDIDLIVPNGTAVQNSRTSLLGDTTTRDGYHMSYDYGRYLTGLLFIKTVTGLSVDGITYAPSGVDAEEKVIAIEAVNNAADSPFTVTKSKYVNEVPEEGYVLLQTPIYQGAYWHPMKDGRYNELINDLTNSNNFFTTIRFTRETLPVGSIITLENGWQYRPDGWISDTLQTGTRESVTTKAFQTVTEEWWKDYTIRSFNISRTTGGSIMDLTEEDMRSIFQIYVPEEKHTHINSSAVTTPTCTEQGYTTYTCTLCGDSYVDSYVNAKGHSYGNWEIVKASTCTEKGAERRDCVNCDHFETRAVAATGHTEVIDAAVAPTCTETGLTEGKHCSVCDAVLVKQDVVKAKGHSYKSVVTAPTCTERGYTTHTCTVCGHSYVDRYVNAKGHSYDAWKATTAPTCTEKGVERRDCVNCDHFETRAVAATGHTEVIDAAVAPACTETGLTEGKHCSVCDAVLVKQDVVKAKGHSYKSVVTAPTCTERGYTTHTCTVCGHSYVDRYVNAKGHSYDAWKATTAPTCTEKGAERRDCVNCDHFETRDVAAKGHTEVIDAAVAPTCTETGLTEGKHCSVCTVIIVAPEILPALGHKYKEWFVSCGATCTTAGEEKRECERCDAFETTVIDALGHTEVIDAAVDPTCVESGLTEGKHCSVCEAVLIPQEILQSLGHAFGTFAPIAIDPELGHYQQCLVCDHVSTLIPHADMDDNTWCDDCNYSMILRIQYFALSHEYILLSAGESAELLPIIEPAGMVNRIVWSSSDEMVFTIDENGVISAKGEGTAYAEAYVSSFGEEYTLRCRVDVSAEPIKEIELKAHIGVTNVTSNIYSTNYAETEIILDLPHYMTEISTFGLRGNGVSIESAYFADEAVAALFDLRVTDDRVLKIVPKVDTSDAAAVKLLKSSYKSAIAVTLVGEEEPLVTPEVLNIRVDKKLPTVKAAAVKFNTFYTTDTKPLVLTSTAGKVTAIEIAEQPDWLAVNSDTMQISVSAQNGKYNGKLKLMAAVEGYTTAIPVTVSVSAAVVKPKVKLSAVSATIFNQTKLSEGISLAVLSSDKKVSYTELGITDISLAELSEKELKTYAGNSAYEIADFDITTGQFLISVREGVAPISGKVLLKVTFNDVDSQFITLPLSIKLYTKAPVLKLSKTSATLNNDLGIGMDSFETQLTVTPADYNSGALDIHVFDKTGKIELTDVLDVQVNGDKIIIRTTMKTEYNATYKISVGLVDEPSVKPVAISIKTLPVNKGIVTLTLTAKGSIDTVRPYATSITLTPKYKNYNNFGVMDEHFTVLATNVKAKPQVSVDVTNKFDVIRNANGTYTLKIKDGEHLDATLKYTVSMSSENMYTKAESKAIALSIKQGSVKVSQSTKTVNLYKSDRFSRRYVTISIADESVLPIARIELQNADKSLFEVIDFGDGLCAIGFKDSRVAPKIKNSSIKLNVFLEGNETTKPNTTITVSVKVVAFR